MKITFNPYPHAEIHFYSGEGTEYQMEYARLYLEGEKKGQTACFSRGIIKLLSEWNSEEEKTAFAKVVYHYLLNSTPFTKGAAYQVYNLYKEGFPHAGEMMAQLAEFYEFSFSIHNLLRWRDVVATHLEDKLG